MKGATGTAYNKHEGATAQLFTHSESGERVQGSRVREVWRTPRVKTESLEDVRPRGSAN